MKYQVRLADEVEADLHRLAGFISEYSDDTARRCVAAIWRGIASLGEMPNRHPLVGDRRRELYIRFGDSGYVVQYRVDPDVVVVARIFHMRETR